MRYASDNRVVRALYTITAGPFRLAFYLAVIAVVGVSLYFPVRDLYTAHRTGEILRAQLAIREAYNNKVQSDVDKLLSTEGIEDTARQNLGLVKPGETAINVVGLDDAEDASAGDAADGSGAAATTDGADAAQADAAEGDAQTANEDGTDAGESADAASASVANDEAEENAEPTTSAEALAAEEAVAADAPWYVHMLDTFFCYTGVNGQKVASTGTSS